MQIRKLAPLLIATILPGVAHAQNSVPVWRSPAAPPDIGQDPNAAVTYWTARIGESDKRKWTLPLADALANRCGALLAAGKIAEAQADCTRSLTLLSADPSRTARQYEARVWLIQAGISGAQRLYDQELALAQKAQAAARLHYRAPSLEVIQADSEVAIALLNLGRVKEAVPAAAAAWDAAKTALPPGTPRRLGIATTYAAALSNARRSAEAEALIRSVFDDAMRLPQGHADRVQVLNRLGYELLLQGRLNEAVPYLRQSVDEGRAGKAIPDADLANYVGTLGLALLALDRPDDARPVLDAALALFGKAGASGGQASTLISAGTAADRSGDIAGGLALRERAMAMLAATAKPNPLTIALGKFKLGQSYAHAGRLDDAARVEREAVGAIAALRPEGHYQRVNSQIALGWIETLRGDAPAGLALVKPAFHRSIADSAALEVAQNKVVGVLENIEAFSQALDAAVRANDQDFAFEVAQILVESDASRAAVAAQTRQQASGTQLGMLLRSRQEAAAAAMDADSAALKAASGNDADVAAKKSQAEALKAKLAAANAQLDAAFPTYRTLLRPTSVTLAEARAQLAADEILLVCVSSDEGLVTLAIGRDGVTIGKSAMRRAEVRKLVAAIRMGVTPGGGAFDVAASHSLYQAIFTPEIAAATRRAKLLTVASDDILSAMPFSMLAVKVDPNGARWLIEDKAIAVTPSIGALALASTRSIEGARHFVGVGAPSLDGSGTMAAGPSYFAAGQLRSARVRAIPPLPGAASELRAMDAVLGKGQGQLLIGDDAQEARLRATDLSHVSVLAFATHGLVAGEFDSVSEPALVFTPPPGDTAPADNDGILTASEAALLHIDADWVILSACNTAAGDRPSAAGYTGLARAFLFAGGRRVLASHWPVRDDISARLTVGAVAGVQKGLRPAEALRQSMLAVMRDASVPEGRAPATWAPFMLVGR